MDFSLTDEQELLVDSVNEFADRYFDEEKINAWYDQHGLPESVSRAYLDAGFGYMGIPEEYGGVPCDKVTLGVLTEAVGHATGAVMPFLNNTLAMVGMLEMGNEDQVKMCLDAYEHTGHPIFSLGFSEPAAGSDNAAMTSVTREQADGSFILSGQKTWVTEGEKPPYCLIVAKEEDPDRKNRDMTMWLVPMNLDGIKTAPLVKIGQTIMPFCELYLDNVKLTPDMLVGERKAGFMNMMKNFEMERALIVAQGLGMAQAAMDDAAAYATERITFGMPIARQEMIMYHLTEMEAKLQNTRSLLYKVLWMMDQGKSTQMESALLKYYGAKACTEVASDALQIYAGLGYTTETRLGRIWKDLRGNQIAGGTDEIMVYICGRQLAKRYARK